MARKPKYKKGDRVLVAPWGYWELAKPATVCDVNPDGTYNVEYHSRHAACGVAQRDMKPLTET